jgi:anti-sigma factor (TIGR02949 family)
MMEPKMEPMLDCDAVMRQLWDYLDGELTQERMAAIEAHVHVCNRCIPQVEFERSFLAALHAARKETATDNSLKERVLSRLRGMGYSE